MAVVLQKAKGSVTFKANKVIMTEIIPVFSGMKWSNVEYCCAPLDKKLVQYSISLCILLAFPYTYLNLLSRKKHCKSSVLAKNTTLWPQGSKSAALTS